MYIIWPIIPKHAFSYYFCDNKFWVFSLLSALKQVLSLSSWGAPSCSSSPPYPLPNWAVLLWRPLSDDHLASSLNNPCAGWKVGSRGHVDLLVTCAPVWSLIPSFACTWPPGPSASRTSGYVSVRPRLAPPCRGSREPEPTLSGDQSRTTRQSHCLPLTRTYSVLWATLSPSGDL